MVDPWLDGGGGVGEERLAEEAGIPPTALRVEDPELGPAPRRTRPVPGDDHLGPLSDHIPAEADPGASSELESKAGRSGDGARDRPRQSRRLEDHEQDIRPTGECRETSEPIRDRGRTPAVSPRPARVGGVPGGAARIARGRQIQDQHVHGPARHERSGHRQRLVERDRFEDDEPFEADPAGDRLDGIETPGEVHVGHDRARRLCPGGQLQSEGGLAARPVATHGQPGRARDPTRAEDGIQRGEPGRDDRIVVGDPGGPHIRSVRKRHHRERADDRPDARILSTGRRPTGPRSGISPARLERRQGRRHVQGKGRHRTVHDRTDVLSSQGATGPLEASCYTLAPVPGAAIHRRPARPLVGM